MVSHFAYHESESQQVSFTLRNTQLSKSAV